MLVHHSVHSAVIQRNHQQLQGRLLSAIYVICAGRATRTSSLTRCISAQLNKFDNHLGRSSMLGAMKDGPHIARLLSVVQQAQPLHS